MKKPAYEMRISDWSSIVCSSDLCLSIFISQSGETADTLAAMRYVKAQGGRTLAIVNVPESSMAREADGILLTKAGPEIGVASTKAFTCQLVTLAAFSLAMTQERKALPAEEVRRLMAALVEVPARAAEIGRGHV